MAKVRHIHKYLRTVTSRSKKVYYRCMLPGCTHYIAVEFVLGKESKCWFCPDGIALIVKSRDGSYPLHPKCASCKLRDRKKKQEDEANSVTSLAEKLLSGIK